MEKLNLILAASKSLTPDEQASVEFWLSIVSGIVVFLIFALIVLAVLIRFIAKRSTQPCYWCMEFISKNETVCPRCGKSLESVRAGEMAAAQNSGGIAK